MRIPQLETSCCGLSLKTGSKIIGWLTLVFGVGGIYMCFLTYAKLTTDENDPKEPDKEVIKVTKILLVPAAIIVVMKVVLGFLLLLGIYQNRMSLIYYWIIANATLLVTDILIAVVSFIMTGSCFGTGVMEAASEAVGIYYILVVYSYYRELAGSYGSYD